MKFLIFGIDGGTQRILEGFEMPFTHGLLKAGRTHERQLDLFSRGWAEVVTGQHAAQTRAFYMGPLMDGSTKFSIKYKTAEAQRDGIEPIWKLAESQGANVGVMNVPTTSPAQEVRGFMVGSGGGGVNKVSGVPEDLVYPSKVKESLESLDYIVDIRLTSSGITDIKTLFQQLTLKEERRTDAYIQLCQQYDVGFGLLVDRATTIIQYLCMFEIEKQLSGEPSDSLLRQLLQDFYSALDRNIERLITELKPEHWLLTADHSTVPYRYKANMAPFLIEHDYLVPAVSQAAEGMVQRLKKLARPFIPQSFKGQLRSALPAAVATPGANIDWQQSVAFGHNYIDGIYLNDARFGGPVTEDQRESLVDEICQKFNENKTAASFQAIAKPYRRQFDGAKYQSHLADILLEKPDEMHIVGTGPFMCDNPDYTEVPIDLSSVKDDMLTGQKGSHPLFVTDETLAQKVQPNDPTDLTLAYLLAQRVFTG